VGRRIQAILHMASERHWGSLPKQPGVEHAIRSMIRCKTEELGGTVHECPDGHERQAVYASCSTAECGNCAGAPRRRTVEVAKEKMLDSKVLQVVMTLDPVIEELWHYNIKDMTNALMWCSAHAVMDLMADPQHLGAQPGIIAALHTVGGAGLRHVHSHLSVTRGGLTEDGRWVNFPAKWTMPYEALSQIFRGKLLNEVKRLARSGDLHLPKGDSIAKLHERLEPLYAKKWNVWVGDTREKPIKLIKYMTRRAYGGPFADKDIVAWGNGGVTIRVGRDKHEDESGKSKAHVEMTLESFLKTVAMHVLPEGVHRIRYYGLYASKNATKLNEARVALGQTKRKKRADPPSVGLEVKVPDGPAPRACHTCGQLLLPMPIPAKPKLHPSWLRRTAAPPNMAAQAATE
jgi:hypothetical protein